MEIRYVIGWRLNMGFYPTSARSAESWKPTQACGVKTPNSASSSSCPNEHLASGLGSVKVHKCAADTRHRHWFNPAPALTGGSEHPSDHPRTACKLTDKNSGMRA